MKTYNVTIRRLQVEDIEVEAESREQAEDMAWDLFDVLDGDPENDIIAITENGKSLPVELPSDMARLEAYKKGVAAAIKDFSDLDYGAAVTYAARLVRILREHGVKLPK